MSFAVGLFFIFCVLKLTGFVAWSWVWITAPLWIALLFFLLVAVAFAVALIDFPPQA